MADILLGVSSPNDDGTLLEVTEQAVGSYTLRGVSAEDGSVGFEQPGLTVRQLLEEVHASSTPHEWTIFKGMSK